MHLLDNRQTCTTPSCPLSGEDIICFAGEDWWYHNPHSNLHIMKALSKANRVLFVNSIGVRMPDFKKDPIFAWKRITGKLKNKLAINFKTILLSIGQVEYRKGYDFLLKAWVDIRKAFESPVLIIAGPNNEDVNPYYSLLKEFMKKNNLHDVVFLGEIDNVEEYMKIADCFVFCSRAEGFGTVLIEAMSASVPVVATNIPGVTEDIIQDEAIGRICYSDSPQEFARLAIDLVKNQNPKKLDESASRVRAKFDISLIAQQYHEMYSQLLNHYL
jgi:glycosyltransferase involved in cell wall biosynthesis